MIIFGWYAFLLRTFTRQDLGNIDVGIDDVIFQVKQKVVHVFWIPVFPIGKQYSFKSRGKSYELPAEIIYLIQQKEIIKTPWYSFALPILAILVFLYLSLQQKWRTYQWEQSQEITFNAKVTQLEKQVNTLSSDHFLKLANSTHRYNDSDLFLDILKIKNDTLYGFTVNTGESVERKHLSYLAEYYNPNIQTDTVKIALETIKEAYYKDYDNYKKRKSIGFSLANKKYKYYIEKVVYMDGLVAQLSKINWKRNTFTIEIETFGKTVVLISAIEDDNSNIKWKNPFPLQSIFNGSGTYSLIGNVNLPVFSFTIIFEDKDKKQYKYLVKIQRYKYQGNKITRI